MADPAAKSVALIVPRENVNDDSVTVLAWLADDGAQVVAGQPLVRIETGKATVDLDSPGSGTLRRQFADGADAPIGAALAWIDPPGCAPSPAAANGNARILTPAPAPTPMPMPMPMPTPMPMLAKLPAIPPIALKSAPAPRPVSGLRMSRKAREWLDRSGINPESLADRGLVRTRDLAPAQPEPAPALPHALTSDPAPPPASASVSAVVGTTKRDAISAPTPDVAHRLEPIPRSKLFEARILEGGTSAALSSVVTIACPTRGLKAAARGSRLLGESAALIIAETARLLRKYPLFNAFRQGDRIGYYEEVNIGYAIDGGLGLKVPVIRGADRLSPAEIASRIREMVERYADDALPASEMAGGTFTITDLSGEGVFSFHPLISQGQSAILGVGGEFLPPGGGPGLFNLILAFDHRLTEGRAAARLLNDLRQRIIGYEAALTPDATAANETVEPSCGRCSRSLTDLQAADGFLVRSVWPDGLICSVCLAGL